MHLPETPDGGDEMGTGRDRAPDLTRSSTEARPLLPTRPSLRPIASTEPRDAVLPWQEPPESGAAPASSVHSPATPPPGPQTGETAGRQ